MNNLPQTANCPHCNSPVKVTAKFCPRCGKPVATAPARGAPPPLHPAPLPPPPPEKRKSKWWLWVIIFLAIGVLCICLAAGGYFAYTNWFAEKPPFTQPTKTIEATPEPVVTRTATDELPAPTEPVAVTEAPPPTEAPALPMADFNGITFTYDPSIAGSISGETMPSTSGAPWEASPAHDQFTVSGYPLSGTFFEPSISIYPVDDFVALAPDVATSVDKLQTLLVSRPVAPGDIPFLPIQNAAQFMQAQVSYIDFQNGSGVRFLTQYGQGYWPINNHDMFYCFQGLTADGKYYISAVLPASYPDLPATGDDYTGSMDDLNNNWAGYISDMVEQLNGYDAASFTPGLDKLDAMFASLKVK
jgi:hypothetical protein